MSALFYEQQEAAGKPQGLLILHHGRGTDERDMLGLAEALDPERRLHVVCPRGPLTIPGSPGFHWYRVPRVGYPDPESFFAAAGALGELHEELWEQTGLGPERTVLGGFSMGCVMSYATGLAPGRPVPAGILAMSGFIPTVEGWGADLAGRPELPVLIAHGSEDPVISVDFARTAARTLQAAGLPVDYHEFQGSHQVVASEIALAHDWLLARSTPDAA
jgi:phospholipase/carboxylesterase